MPLLEGGMPLLRGPPPEVAVRVAVLEEGVAGAVGLLVRPAVHRREVAVELPDAPFELGPVVQVSPPPRFVYSRSSTP